MCSFARKQSFTERIYPRWSQINGTTHQEASVHHAFLRTSTKKKDTASEKKWRAMTGTIESVLLAGKKGVLFNMTENVEFFDLGDCPFKSGPTVLGEENEQTEGGTNKIMGPQC